MTKTITITKEGESVASIHLSNRKLVVTANTASLKTDLEAEIEKLTHLLLNASDPQLVRQINEVKKSSKSDMIVLVPWVEERTSNTQSISKQSGFISHIYEGDGRAIVHGERPATIEDPEFLSGLWHMLQNYSSKFGLSSDYWLVL